MSSAPDGGSDQQAGQGVQKLVDLASRELQKRVVAQSLLAESSGVREQARALRQSDGDAPSGPSQEELDRFSFLWNGPEPERTVYELPAQTREDLQLAGIVRAMAIHGSAERYLTALLGAQLSTVEQIGHRQSVLQTILAHPPLEEVVREAGLRIILAGPLTTMDNRAALYRVVNHLSELELYVTTTEALADAVAAVDDAGPVWRDFAALLDRIRETPEHRQLLSFLPSVLQDVRGMASVTIGVNLDAQLRPVEATLLSINRERFKGSKLMSTVLGKAAAEGRGIADLHSLLRPGHAKPLVRELLDDLAQVLDRAARQLAGDLRAFTKLPTGFITRASEELILFASAAKLAHTLQERRLPVCLPRVADTERRVLSIDGCYNAALALAGGEEIVSSEVELGEPGRVAVLTGPNRGGKTVYLQGVGLAQVLFQAGLFCPARDAEMSIASGLYTHYQAEEKPQQQTGRFGEEAARLREILTRLTPTAVLLSNETFTSTGPGEAAYLMLDIVRVLVALGCRSLLATHLHELAAWVEDEQVPGAFNLAATTREVPADGVPRVVPTFRVERAPPAGHSHARTVAHDNGLLFEQIVDSLRERGQLDGPVASPG